MTEEIPELTVDEWDKAIELSLEKWKDIRIKSYEISDAYNNACGFCHYAIYLKGKATPEERKGKHKCNFCADEVEKFCKSLIASENLSNLDLEISEVIRFLNELKTPNELKGELTS
ncbi:hypothetical protein ES702_01956 [subsurface metagenome]